MNVRWRQLAWLSIVAGGDGDVAKVAAEFIASIARHRAWSREAKAQRIPV